MPKETPAQKKTVDRVMHEFKHGELESGPEGKAGKVKNPRQAIAIALSEAGVSNRKSPGENARNRKTTRTKEAHGETAQQEAEGRSAPEHNRAELYEEAKARNIPGRSKMTKAQLEKALR
jgi:hypothetical protein